MDRWELNIRNATLTRSVRGELVNYTDAAAALAAKDAEIAALKQHLAEFSMPDCPALKRLDSLDRAVEAIRTCVERGAIKQCCATCIDGSVFYPCDKGKYLYRCGLNGTKAINHLCNIHRWTPRPGLAEALYTERAP